MKDFMRSSLVAILAAASAAGPVFHSNALAQTAATDPVGFISVNVGAGSPTLPTLSLISPTLLRPVEWQGAATISGTTVTVAGTPWTAAQFGTNGQYFVEIATGTTPGAWTDIQSSTTNTLTTLDNISAFAGASPTVRIRKHTKLTDFLGVNNSAGLLGGTSMATADEVLVYDGTNYVRYWYYDGSDSQGAAGWRNESSQSAANVVIAPNEGIVVRRRGSTPVNFTALGSVKTGNTLVPVQAGLNVVGAISAKGLTLATSGLYTGNASTGLRGSTSPATADEVTIYSPAGQKIYWYYDASDSAGAAGWYDYNYQLSNSVSIAPGSSVVIKRRAPGVAFNWTVPSPTSF